MQRIPHRHLIFKINKEFKDFLWDKTFALTPGIEVTKMVPEPILHKDGLKGLEFLILERCTFWLPVRNSNP